MCLFIWLDRRLKNFAKSAKQADFRCCFECNYAIEHRYAPCPECGDKSPAYTRDVQWLKFLFYTRKPLDYYRPSPLATADQLADFRSKIPNPQALFRIQRTRRMLMYGFVFTLIAAAITQWFLHEMTEGWFIYVICIINAPSVLINLRFARDLRTAYLFEYRNRAFCIPCGCPLNHTHDECPECRDATPPAVRDEFWRKFFKSLWIKLPSD